MKKKVKVIGPYSVDYEDKLYVPGDSLEMDKGEADRLIKKGIVAEVADEVDEDESSKAKGQKAKGKK